MKNPLIIKFLEKYDKSEWDTILEDLLLYSINKIKEIEKEEKTEKENEEQKYSNYLNQRPNIVSINSSKMEPFEYSMNYLIENAQSKANPQIRKKTLSKLDKLNQQINNIQSKVKTKGK